MVKNTTSFCQNKKKKKLSKSGIDANESPFFFKLLIYSSSFPTKKKILPETYFVASLGHSL